MDSRIGDNLVGLISSGSSGDDPGADTELWRGAVEQYIDLVDKPKLPPVLLKVRGSGVHGWGGMHARVDGAMCLEAIIYAMRY